jgi:hypothetical protein
MGDIITYDSNETFRSVMTDMLPCYVRDPLGSVVNIRTLKESCFSHLWD